VPVESTFFLRERKKRRRTFVLTIVAIIVTCVYAFPSVWLILTSFKSRIDIFSIPPKFIFKPSLENYLYTFQRGHFFQTLLNSAFISFASVLLAMVLTIFAAYAVSRMPFKGSNFVMFLILSFRMMPAAVVVIPMFLLYRMLKLVNTYQGMILLYTAFSVPFSMWMIKSFIDEVPRHLDDAALSDGASVPRTIFSVVLPQLGPALVSVLLFNLIFVWNEFLFAYILTGIETRTIPAQIAVGIYTDKGVDWEYVTSLSTVFVSPILVIIFWLQKYLIRGLTFGTVKR
jgi:multiple sugar transport system permease protein